MAHYVISPQELLVAVGYVGEKNIIEMNLRNKPNLK